MSPATLGDLLWLKGFGNHCERNWLNFKPHLITPQNILASNSGNIYIGPWDSSPLTESWVINIFLTWNQNQNLVFGHIYLKWTAGEHSDSGSWVTGGCSLITKVMAWLEWTQQMVGGEEGYKYRQPEGVCFVRRWWNRWQLLVDVVSTDRFFQWQLVQQDVLWRAEAKDRQAHHAGRSTRTEYFIHSHKGESQGSGRWSGLITNTQLTRVWISIYFRNTSENWLTLMIGLLGSGKMHP